MNILFVDQFSDPGGAQFCLRDLIPEVLRRRWNAHLMAPGEGDLLGWFRSLGVPTLPLPLRHYANGRKTPLDFLRFTADAPRVASAIRRTVEKDGIDLVYVNGPRVMPSVAGVGRPVVFHAHNQVTSPAGRRLIRWALKRTNAAVIAASKFVAQSLPREQPCEVVYNGTADMGFRTRSFAHRSARVGIVGRIAPQKGQMDFLRAAPLVPNARFFVYGASMFSDPSYEQAVRQIAAGAPVEFAGWAGDVSRVLSNLDILAVPSGPGEAATRVIMEAFSAGVPVVAYRSGGIGEIVEHGRTGILTETSNYESLARNIAELLTDPNRMEHFSIAGRAEWERRFTVERFRANICDFMSATISIRSTSWASECSHGTTRAASGTRP